MDPGLEACSLNLRILMIILPLLEGCGQGQLASHFPVPEVAQMKEAGQGVYLHLRSEESALAHLEWFAGLLRSARALLI